MKFFTCHLNNVKILDISYCQQLTDKALINLKHLNNLNISSCRLITNIPFKNFVNIQELCMSYCDQEMITDDIFNYITNVKKLNIRGCFQLKGDKLKKLKLLEYIDVKYTNIKNEDIPNQPGITIIG